MQAIKCAIFDQKKTPVLSNTPIAQLYSHDLKHWVGNLQEKNLFAAFQYSRHQRQWIKLIFPPGVFVFCASNFASSTGVRIKNQSINQTTRRLPGRTVITYDFSPLAVLGSFQQEVLYPMCRCENDCNDASRLFFKSALKLLKTLCGIRHSQPKVSFRY